MIVAVTTAGWLVVGGLGALIVISIATALVQWCAWTGTEMDYLFLLPANTRCRGALRRFILAPDISIGLVFDRAALNPIKTALIAIPTAIFGVGTLFSFVEPNVSMPDGWWWAYISMTTVGYGDIAPKTPEIRTMAIVVIGLGIASTALLTGALLGRVAAVQRQRFADTPELDDDFAELREAIDERLDRLSSICSHPKVVAALREIHDETTTGRTP